MSTQRYSVHITNHPVREFDDADDAIHYAMGRVYCGPIARDEAYGELINGRQADWVYGFSSVTIYPTKEVA